MSWRACGSVLLFIGLAGCFSPSFEDGKLQCGPAAQCPPGLSCVDGLCRTGATAGDAATPMVTLTVARSASGSGTGSVSSMPAGIACPAVCDASFPAGTTITLTASADPGSTFAGWEGACAGTDACAITLTADTTVTADFVREHIVTVSTTGPGSGIIVSSPAGISCPGTCTSSFVEGTMLSLTATPTAPATFAGWSGAGCSGSGTCTFTVTGDAAVQAAFAANDTLVVSKAGTGTGTVTSSPSGIACGTTCSQLFPQGSMVTLTATADAGSTFTGWSGACSGTGACVVTINAAEMVTATFAPQQYALSVARTGNGSGTVTSSPAGIACGSTCSANYTYGTMVTLTATPATASTFTGWSGGGCSGTGMCTVTMTGPLTVTASFSPTSNLVFVTKATIVPKTMGGLAGADAFCQNAASAAGLPGTYKAWLSSSTSNAIDRLGSASGWVRTDGAPFANTAADLANGRLFHPAILDETGAFLGDVQYMTATDVGGVYDTALTECDGFTTSTGFVACGDSAGTGSMFDNGWASDCTGSFRLLCLGLDRSATVIPSAPTAPVRRAFMRFWTPGGGIADADAACQSDATAAGLPGTYLALLPTTTTSALGRFDTTGPPWVRVDNVPVLPTAAAWATASYFDASPGLSANGMTYFGNYPDWNGSSTMTGLGSTTTNCNNWTATTGSGSTSTAGTTQITGTVGGYAFWSALSTQACNFASATITCLQK